MLFYAIMQHSDWLPIITPTTVGPAPTFHPMVSRYQTHNPGLERRLEPPSVQQLPVDGAEEGMPGDGALPSAGRHRAQPQVRDFGQELWARGKGLRYPQNIQTQETVHPKTHICLLIERFTFLNLGCKLSLLIPFKFTTLRNYSYA